jgi:Putative zinc-finger
LNCKAVVLQVSNYIDRDLDAAVRQELEAHLLGCEDCTLIIRQTRLTIEIFCDEDPVQLDAGVHERLFEALRRRFRQSGTSI